MRQDAATGSEGCLTCLELHCLVDTPDFLIVAICDRPLCNSRCALLSSCYLWLSFRNYNTFVYISDFPTNDDDSHQLTTWSSEPKDRALLSTRRRPNRVDRRRAEAASYVMGFLTRRDAFIVVGHEFASCRRADPIQEIMRISHRDHDHTQKEKYQLLGLACLCHIFSCSEDVWPASAVIP